MDKPSPDASVTFPPSTLAALREIAAQMHRGQLDLSLGKRSRAALSAMLDDPQEVAMSNISRLSVTLGVSPATLTRLAKLLGFRGFPQLQGVFRAQTKQADHFYSSQAGALVGPGSARGMLLLETLASQASGNIRQGIAQTDPAALAQGVEWLARSTQVHVFGYRQSAALASMMAYCLSMIRGQVQLMGTQGQGLSVGISQIRRQEVVVLFASAPYSRETVLAAKLARKQLARVVAVTDSHHSPLAGYADVTLIQPSDSAFYSSSLIGTVFMIEGVLSLVAKTLGQTAVDNLRLRETLIGELNDQV